MLFLSPFYRYLRSLSLGEILYINDNFDLFLSLEEVQTLLESGGAVDGSNGGLVTGKFHNEGGIHVIQPHGDKYKYILEMEGYEYLINPIATERHLDWLVRINEEVKNDKSVEPKPFFVPEQIKVIDARNNQPEIILVSQQSQFIVNRAATEKNLFLLDAINRPK